MYEQNNTPKRANAMPKSRVTIRGLMMCGAAVLTAATMLLFCSSAKAEAGGAPYAGEVSEEDAGEEIRNDGMEAEIESSIESLLSGLDLSHWDKAFVSSDGSGTAGLLADDAETLIGSIINGEAGFDAGSIVKGLAELLIPEVGTYLRSMIPLAAVMLLGGFCAVLFKGDGMEKPLALALAAVSVLSVTTVFASVAGGASRACSEISSFCETVAPALGLIMTVCGLTQAHALLLPKLGILSAGISTLMNGIAIPLLLFSGVLVLIGAFNERFRLNNMVKLAHSAVKWLIGLASVVYSGTLLFSGVLASASDGVTLRGAKYALDKLMPIGGGIVTATVDASAYGAHIVKNAAGIAAIVILVKLILRPLLTIVGGMLAFRVTAAMLEPFSEPRIPAALASLADTLSYLFACCACSAAMLALTVFGIIAAGKALY